MRVVILVVCMLGCADDGAAESPLAVNFQNAATSIEAKSRAFWAGVTPIIDGAQVPPLGGACPHEPPSEFGHLGHSILRNRQAVPRYIYSRRSELAAARGLWERTGRTPPPPIVQKLNEVIDGSYWHHVETVLVTTTHETAQLAPDERSYQPGTIRGWMISWDYAADRVVCAGAVDATTSSDVTSTGDSWQLVLRNNLWLNGIRAGAQSLRSVE
ncbi:MAG: hypothetical protein AAF449_08470 [Myxococcota bacterium]